MFEFERLARTLGPRIGLWSLAVKERQPEIFLAAGVGAGIASAVMLAKAHRRSDEVFDNVSGEIEAVRENIRAFNKSALEHNEQTGEDHMVEVSRTDEQRVLAPLYLEATKRAVLLYGPATLMGVASVTLVLASHSSLRRRNRALISTIALIERGFAQYRKRVVDELGPEADERFWTGAEARSKTTVTTEDGKKKRKKETKNHLPEEISPIMYQRVFDETNQNWSTLSEMNEFFLKMIEQEMQNRLDYKGWVTLNTCYKALGFEASPEGAVVGWSKNVPGDDFVSFGIFEDINMRENDIRFLLDFNVNGVILNHIGAK